jgi:hypothetical protein
VKAVLALSALLLSPSGAFAETEAELRERFIAAVRDNGCRMTEDEADAILPGLGFEKDAVAAIIPDLEADGVIELDDDKFNLTLRAEGCP